MRNVVGVQYPSDARYLVDDETHVTVGRFNSLKNAKAFTRTLKGWHLYDIVDKSSIGSKNTKRSFEAFINPDLYPTMYKCSKLMVRFIKCGVNS